MASSVIVLAPNGRRQTVKVTPNTTILQILEEVCKKQGLNADEFDIKHHRKVLDTTANIRFSGLPNNALLELVEATVARKESDVVLGLQMEDGNRLMGNFSPSVSLWEVLSNLCPAELCPGVHPVIIYMRQEIFGLDSLKSTSLKSLGLTGGRAMLRLIHRSPDVPREQANVSAPLPSKPVEEKPYVRQFQRLSPVKDLIAPQAQPQPTKEEPADKRNVPKDQVPAPQKPQPFPSTQTGFANLIKNEKRKQTEGIKTKNISRNEATVANNAKHTTDEFVFLGDRNAMLFSLETAKSVKSEDLPDDFYELSISDIKKLFRDIRKQRLEMENGPLLTSTMRGLEDSKKQLRQLNQYKKAVIRVQFPSRLVLQGVFAPTETVQHVMNFVREYLDDSSVDFYLFMTPPKTVLPKTATLIEINCVPGALMYYGSDVKSEKYLRSDILEKLTSTSMASFAASKLREENKRVVAREPEDDLCDLLQPGNEVNIGASTSTAPTPVYDCDKKTEVHCSPPEKLPKWFKPTK